MISVIATVRHLALAILFAAAGARCADPQGIAINGTVARLHVDDPRPLVEALYQLSSAFGWRVGFEEARLAYRGDLIDVTSPSYRPKSEDDRAWNPRGGPLDLDFSVNARTQQPDEPLVVIHDLLAEYAGRGYPGRYSFTAQSGGNGYIYVFPDAVANTSGVMERTRAVSATTITISVHENEKIWGVLTAACKQLEGKIGTRVLYGGHGTVTQGDFQPAGPLLAAHDEPAHLFLDRAVTAVGFRFWQLLYDPRLKWYGLAYR